MNLDIYLVSRPEDIVEAWSLVKPGFEEVMKKGHGEESLDYILSQLITNQLFLWVVFNEDKEYVGFLTTKKIFHNWKGQQVGVLLVNHWYKHTKTFDRKFNDRLNEFVMSHAKETGCKFIKMYTARDNNRVWQSLGFQKTYTEYVREVSED